MRPIVATLTLALAACGSESQPDNAPASAPDAAAASAAAAPLMAIPDDPKALERLKEMGYTVHAEQGHLHAPGVDGCPAAGGGVAM